MKIEIELQEIEHGEIRDDELTLIIRNYEESKIHVSLEIVKNESYAAGFILVNLEALRKALDKVAL